MQKVPHKRSRVALPEARNPRSASKRSISQLREVVTAYRHQQVTARGGDK
jgi:hypothetical protein